jgi:uncharacterized cupin superfamily protein
MHHVNLTAPDCTYDADDPEGYRCGVRRLGLQFGASRTGATLYELPPGQALRPYHYEYAEEEWLLVVAGRPAVRDPEGTHRLEPDDVIVQRSSAVDYWHGERG